MTFLMEEILKSPLPHGGCAQLHEYCRYEQNTTHAQASLNKGIITTTAITSEMGREVQGVQTSYIFPAVTGFCGRALPQAVSGRFRTAAGRDPSRLKSLGFAVNTAALGQVFFQYFGFPLTAPQI
jgi:hypothetical protein